VLLSLRAASLNPVPERAFSLENTVSAGQLADELFRRCAIGEIGDKATPDRMGGA
jgi:hypothetical protein